MIFQRIAYYLNPRNFFKREKADFTLRTMHTVNKISILMFVICLMVMIIRWITR